MCSRERWYCLRCFNGSISTGRVHVEIRKHCDEYQLGPAQHSSRLTDCTESTFLNIHEVGRRHNQLNLFDIQFKQHLAMSV